MSQPNPEPSPEYPLSPQPAPPSPRAVTPATDERSHGRPHGRQELLHLLGVVRTAHWPSLQRRLRDVPGGRDLGALPFGFLAALHRPAAPLGLVDESGAMTEDLTHLGRLAAEHEGLLQAIQDHGPLLPAGLGSLFTGEAALAALLETRQGAIASFLDRVRGCREWRLDVVDLSPPSSSLEQKLAAGGSGAGYLAARSRALHSRAGSGADSSADPPAAAEPVLRDLALPAWEWRRLPAPPRGSRTLHPRALHRRAALVPDQDADALRATVEGHRPTVQAHGLELHLSGPFPPYSFVPDLGLGADAG